MSELLCCQEIKQSNYADYKYKQKSANLEHLILTALTFKLKQFLYIKVMLKTHIFLTYPTKLTAC